MLASSFIALLSMASSAIAAPTRAEAKAALPPYWLLAGDSTTATQSANGGGWGDGFLNKTLKNGATGHNYGHNGATTVSFRSGGDWATVLAQIAAKKSAYNCYVTIQFGHNDQKSVSDADFKANLIQFTKDVKGAGGTPILVTPLSRRGYSGGKIVENLANQTRLAIEAATSTTSRYIDLNRASTDYLNAIGETAAHTYDLKSGDSTHLNVWGSVVFGRMVSDLLLAKYSSDFSSYTLANATLSALIKEGKPA